MVDVLEIWKPVCHGYEVSNLGNVRSYRPKCGRGDLVSIPRLLKPALFKSGYRFVNIDRKYLKVSRVVCKAFYGPSDLQVNHKNGIKSDDRLENLEYCTPSENSKHAYNTGLNKRGSDHHKSKLTEEQVKKIIIDHRPQRTIAREYNIAQTTVRHIKTRKIWKWLQA